MALATLVGRDDEVALLGALVRQVERQGSALVLRGEVGVGKSALLDVVRRRAAEEGREVLGVVGVESEAQVPFSGLHRLLRPLLPGVADLPSRQRDALLSAFGMTEAPAEPYLVSYAALELVAERAAVTPVLLVADDVQWLDAPSAAALAFVARRVEHEPVVVLLALREGTESPVTDGSLRELQVTPLRAADAARVLDLHAPGLPESARRDVLERAAGNPLALVELGRTWSPSDLCVVPPVALSTRVEHAFARRLDALPDDARRAALVTAASDSDELVEVVRALETLTGQRRGEDLVHAAVAGGVLVVDGSKVRFRHPLLRSACYHGALPSHRRAAHAALAAVLAGSDRRTWHRAAAATGPDEGVAADLESAAEAAVRRGAPHVGVAALARAAGLSGTGAGRGRRLTAAAVVAFEAALHVQGADLLDAAAACDLTEEDRLRVSWLQEWFGGPTWSGAEKVRALCDLARRLAARGQRDQAARIVLDVALRCWWSNPDGTTTAALVETAEGLGLAPDDPRLVTILAYGAPVARGRVVTERLAAFAPDSLELPGDALNLGTAATGVGAFPLAAPLLDSAIVRLRARGEMVPLLRALVARMLTDHHLGRWDAVRVTGEEVRRLTVDTAQPLWGMAAAATEALTAATQGDDEGLEALGRDVDGFFLGLGATTFMAPVELARGHAALSQGRHEAALHHLRRVSEPRSAVHHRHAWHWTAVDHVAAAVALGRRDEATRLLETMSSLWRTTRSPLLGASLLVARPLVADGAGAEALYRGALPGRLTPWPFLHARHLLAYGTWLRRRRRVRESRPFLRSSREMFDALGAVRWYEQATGELRAAGEASRARTPGAGLRLSPQERQIAQLAATGLTNREIGQHLYLSHRTVGSHLYRIFPKLGITSRGQLAAVLLGDHAGRGAG